MPAYPCGCENYGDGSVGPCARHAADLEPTVECRMCGEQVPERLILGDRVCSECAEVHGLIQCDNCGRVLHWQQTVERPEIGIDHLLHRWRYCHACVAELQREFVA